MGVSSLRYALTATLVLYICVLFTITFTPPALPPECRAYPHAAQRERCLRVRAALRRLGQTDDGRWTVALPLTGAKR